jgi:hypothetical protein
MTLDYVALRIAKRVTQQWIETLKPQTALPVLKTPTKSNRGQIEIGIAIRRPPCSPQ